MSDRVKEWKLLNQELFTVLTKIDSTLTGRGVHDVYLTISGGYIHKATNSLKAINLLYQENLPEEAQAIIRIIFELRLTFDCFLKMGSVDRAAMCLKVLDCMMLEKVKQARASKFGGIPEETQGSLLETEKSISKKYETDELKKMKRYGFTGMPIEQRALYTGHEIVYNIIYRNFSRNIHATDHVEGFIRHKKMKIDEHDEYIESRDISALYTAHFSAAGMAEFANHVFEAGFDSELSSISKKQLELKKDDV